jgi:hypothetical protein
VAGVIIDTNPNKNGPSPSSNSEENKADGSKEIKKEEVEAKKPD